MCKKRATKKSQTFQSLGFPAYLLYMLLRHVLRTRPQKQIQYRTLALADDADRLGPKLQNE
jgi:hypothetical protein